MYIDILSRKRILSRLQFLFDFKSPCVQKVLNSLKLASIAASIKFSSDLRRRIIFLRANAFRKEISTISLTICDQLGLTTEDQPSPGRSEIFLRCSISSSHNLIYDFKLGIVASDL